MRGGERRCGWPRTASPSSGSRRPPSPAAFIPKVVLYTAAGCHLCDAARRTLAALRDELAFELEEIDIAGDAELEARHREWLPVVEIDGRRAFTYFVHPDSFRKKLAQAWRSEGTL